MRKVKVFKRKDGEVAIRNTIIVISLVHCANSTAEKIAAQSNVPVITIDTGCGEFHDDEERTNLGLIRAGQHPNVYGVLLISLGCQWTDPKFIANEILKTDTKVEHLCIQKEQGIANTIEKGCLIVQRMKEESSVLMREEADISQLRFSMYCGGSDWSSSLAANPTVGECMDLFAEEGAGYISSPIRGMPGGEQHLVRLARNKQIGEQILRISEEYRNTILERTGQQISDVNPTPGNKANGITTLREKAISNLELSGTRTPLEGVIPIGEKIPGPGFWIVDNRKGGNDIYACTALAMAGAHICLFTTGQGTPMGTIGPVTIKISANPETIKKLGAEMIDYDASKIISENQTIPDAGRELFEKAIQIINGEESKAEQLGECSWVTPPCGMM